MARARKPWVRGAVVIGLAGAMMAAALMSPALAVRLATTSYVKAKVKAVSNSVGILENRVGGLEGRVAAVEGMNALQYIQGASTTVPAGGFASPQATCPAGTFVTGGGLVTNSFGIVTVDTYPTNGGALSPAGYLPQGRTAWGADVTDIGGGGGAVRAYAICQAVDSTGGNYTPGVDPFRTATRTG